MDHCRPGVPADRILDVDAEAVDVADQSRWPSPPVCTTGDLEAEAPSGHAPLLCVRGHRPYSTGSGTGLGTVDRCGVLTKTPQITRRPERYRALHSEPIRQFCGVEIDVRCCRGAKTAHPEKTKRERHLRSSRTFQRDRLSPSDADSSVSHCSDVSATEPGSAARSRRSCHHL